MSFLNSLLNIVAAEAKKSAATAVKNAVNKAACQSENFTFTALPKSLDELKALPEADLTTPYKAAALTVCALCVYAENRDAGVEMLNFLKGPQPLTPREIQFMNDRLMDGKSYVPVSYFAGAAPDNNYTPASPYQITVESNPYSFGEENYATLYMKSGGADSPRQIKLRRKGEQWFLWEQYLLPDIRKPAAEDPWA